MPWLVAVGVVHSQILENQKLAAEASRRMAEAAEKSHQFKRHCDDMAGVIEVEVREVPDPLALPSPRP